jgi:putative nucleotidyltransferase with HDIG domain
MAKGLQRIRLYWRQLLRLERPRQALVLWRAGGLAALLVACLAVALISSWPWLVEPSPRIGMASPFTVLAPKDARVMDNTALEERRTRMLPRTRVQVVDERLNLVLESRLNGLLEELRNEMRNGQPKLDSLNLRREERLWLTGLRPPALIAWEQAVQRAQRRMLSQGVVANLAEHTLLQAARLQLEDQLPAARSLGSRLVVTSLRGNTNLRDDPFLSQRRIEDLVSRQGLPTISIQRGDLITQQGESITPQAFDVLDYFGLINRRPRPLAWFSRFAEALAACITMVLVMRRWRASLEPRQGLLALFMLLVVQAFKLWLGPLASPLALLLPPTLLLAQGLGTMAGLAWLAVGSLLWPYPLTAILEGRLLVASLFAALAAILAGRQRNRAQLLQLAVLLPAGALVLQWVCVQLASFGGMEEGRFPRNGDLLNESLLVGGLLMAGLLLAPLMESFFGLLTRARLMELADLERPLLRRLSTEAPGTFEHTLMICGLAEEGARAIQADVDLIRTGALYHDVGKLHGPQWFIENQEEGLNPHETLNDPLTSAAILQAHVDEGLRLARRYRLPRPLSDFIPEHQGTLKMGYFLHQARERDPTVPEARFRYAGPIPRSRETAILMMADGCEAALRSLPPGTNETEAAAMVRRIVEARQNDGQLALSGIGRAELELVIRAFVRVWKRMRHRRIAYPIPARKAFSA